MTPFMLSVLALLEGQAPPDPETEPSRARSTADATDTQVLVRSLAEQLVCEANSVLKDHGTRALTLVDDTGPGTLAFTVGYGPAAARVQTEVTGRTAVGRLLAPGLPDREPRQLTSQNELQALILGLIAATPHSADTPTPANTPMPTHP